ncbi:MAG: aminopeptidase [Chitinivibrionales bacterium]|nr:aminopeptidase [Chitinivibrionales bacterium]
MKLIPEGLVMKVSVVSKAASPTRVIPVVEEDTTNIVDFSGEKQHLALRYDGDECTIYCGLGPRKECTSALIRRAAAQGVQKALELKRTKLSVIPPRRKKCKGRCIDAACEGAILGTYRFSRYKSQKPPRIQSIEIESDSLSSHKLKEIQALCESVFYARDLVNDNAHVITPSHLANEAKKLGESPRIKTTVLDQAAIRKKGLGLLDAVGHGSPFPPRLAIMEYTGNKKVSAKTAVVGKGITFDSGGQNHKPSGHIETMRHDMAGAATVLGLMHALNRIKPDVNVTGVVTAAHNACGSRGYFPGDTYKSYSGKWIEIGNTDAEGRLALADAFSYCQKHYKPSELIDLATLTGGILYALGTSVAGLFSNDNSLSEKLFQSGERTYERLWRLPVYEEHSESMKSDIADLKNISKFKKGIASSITAAAFLQEFIEKIPWAHLDIAGTAFNDGESTGEISKYATGFGIRLLMDYLVSNRG